MLNLNRFNALVVGILLFILLFLGVLFVDGLITNEVEASVESPVPFSDAAFVGDVLSAWGASNSFCGLAVPDGNISDASDCLRMIQVNNCVFLVSAYLDTYRWSEDTAREYVTRCLSPLQFVLDALESGSPALPRS